MHSETSHVGSNNVRLFLTGGVLAGPVYVLLGLVQMVIRPGFDPTRQDLSLLSNGNLGWIQIGNFLLTGSLVIAAALGMRRVLGGRAWEPWLLGMYGLGLIGAGIFVADPMNGFPLGTPAGAPVHPTIHGLLHIIVGAFGFVGLIAACFVFARRFLTRQQPEWAVYSLLTGSVFLAGFFGIAAGSQQKSPMLQIVTLAFTAAVLLAWSWISAVSIYVKNHL
jgi:hypothetical protein